jgi:hypothetical protein
MSITSPYKLRKRLCDELRTDRTPIMHYNPTYTVGQPGMYNIWSGQLSTGSPLMAEVMATLPPHVAEKILGYKLGLPTTLEGDARWPLTPRETWHMLLLSSVSRKATIDNMANNLRNRNYAPFPLALVWRLLRLCVELHSSTPNREPFLTNDEGVTLERALENVSLAIYCTHLTRIGIPIAGAC